MSARAPAARGRRRQQWVLLTAATSWALLLPAGWHDGSWVGHATWSANVLVCELLVLLAVARAREPERRYDEAVARATALHVHLSRVRVLHSHHRYGTTMLTLSWQGARTDLLDEDGRVLHAVRRNCLRTGYTLTLPVGDPEVAQRLVHEHAGGTVDLYAVVDLVAHPGGSVAEHGVVLEGYAVRLGSWSGTLTACGELATY